MNKADAIAWLCERYPHRDDADVLDGMVGSLENGWIEAVGLEDGELRFRITDAGRAHVESMGVIGP